MYLKINKMKLFSTMWGKDLFTLPNNFRNGINLKTNHISIIHVNVSYIIGNSRYPTEYDRIKKEYKDCYEIFPKKVTRVY